MKAYHTTIVINTSAAMVWDALTDFAAYPEWNPLVAWLRGDFATGGQIQLFITPLQRAFTARLTLVQPGQAFTWLGVQFAPWFLAGEHYYRLEPVDGHTTRLVHGEYFRGLGSAFISAALLTTMEDTFHRHNQRLKERLEGGPSVDRQGQPGPA